MRWFRAPVLVLCSVLSGNPFLRGVRNRLIGLDRLDHMDYKVENKLTVIASDDHNLKKIQHVNLLRRRFFFT